MSSIKQYYPPKQLDEATLKVARKELNEKDAKQVAADIQYIRDWIFKQQDYMNSRTDDDFILAFLRYAKFSYSRTQELIKNFWIDRTEMPEYFKDRNLNDDSVLLEIGDSGMLCVLPHTDNAGRRILINQMNWDVNKHDFDDIIKYGFAVADIMVDDPRIQINGVVLLMDASNFNASYLPHITPTRLQKLTKCFQDAFPVRIKEIHFFNYPKIFDAVLSLVKPFLKDKIKKRMFFHGSDVSSVHKHFSKKILPKEYGGDLGTIASFCSEMEEYMKLRYDVLKQFEEYGVNMSKLPKNDNNNKALNANGSELAGTFKKLQVD